MGVVAVRCRACRNSSIRCHAAAHAPGGRWLRSAASLLLRTGALDAGYWIDEGIAVGIASHAFGDIPRALGQDGKPPLYYLLLHGWMAARRHRRGGHARAVAAVRAARRARRRSGPGRAVVRPPRRRARRGRRGGLPVPDVLRAGDADVLAGRPALDAGVARASCWRSCAAGAEHVVLLGAVARAAALHAHLGPVPGGGDGRRVAGRCGGAGASRRATARCWRPALALAYAPWLPSLLSQAAPHRARRGRSGRRRCSLLGVPRRPVRLSSPAAARARRSCAARPARPPLDRGHAAAGADRRRRPRCSAWLVLAARAGVGARATSRSCSARCCSRSPPCSRAGRAGRRSRWSACSSSGCSPARRRSRATCARSPSTRRAASCGRATSWSATQPEQVPVLVPLPARRGLRYLTPLGPGRRPAPDRLARRPGAPARRAGRVRARPGIQRLARGRRVLLVTPVLPAPLAGAVEPRGAHPHARVAGVAGRPPGPALARPRSARALAAATERRPDADVRETVGVNHRLLLVRHGESTWNAEHRLQGQADPPLSELGREQAEALLPFLDGIPERRLSSDLTRAVQTAELLGLAGAPQDPRWREIDIGEWAGFTLDELDPERVAAWQRGELLPGRDVGRAAGARGRRGRRAPRGGRSRGDPRRLHPRRDRAPHRRRRAQRSRRPPTPA